eukprot:NODE_6350_length_634_cov_18.647863_g5408_i0.p1 GENE.NODE_6350_length_634_cov_18.647863_g5408_i0~~NODE_6350_length_634_cov_18.647863_g5408_i0.p1  ORF type:complete len:162 (+),score=25.53 NODE_6350_length_634_cov_18.647863_g5408_i0:55-540(+)
MDVPGLSLVDESGTSKEANFEHRRDSVHVDFSRKSPEVRRADAIKYFTDYNIPETMNLILGALLKNKPPQPVSFCISFLRTQAVLNSEDQEIQALQQHVPATPEQERLDKAYLVTHRIPFLFDELLNSLLTEKPEDPHYFCLKWFRWNRQNYEDGDEPNPL